MIVFDCITWLQYRLCKNKKKRHKNGSIERCKKCIFFVFSMLHLMEKKKYQNVSKEEMILLEVCGLKNRKSGIVKRTFLDELNSK